MRLRQLVLACGLTSLVLSPYASALGLGEVKLKSTLNQPLEAEVKLLDTRDLTAEQILVALASPADFERNGVDRLFFYTEFQFQVDLEAADGPKVVITSRSPVREPYLNFLIEARWTAGRLLREYTLLMDLPTFDDGGATQAVQTAVTSNKSQQPRSTTSTPKATSDSGYTSEPRQVPSARQPSLSGDEYEVRSNDTLWEVALRARPDSSVSVHQSMMALYRANPEAFINGNINRLRRGQVLRVPDASEMKSLNKSEAVSQFAQATGDSNSGAQLNASRRTSSTRAESTEVSGRVKLAAPSAGTASTGQGSGANDGAGKALESELAVTLEELDKSKAENTELSSRVKDLEAQIETMERLVEVSNEKLRALQVAAGQAASSPAEVAEAPIVAEPVAAVADVASSEAVVASSEAAASSVAAVAPPQPAPPKKVIVPPKPEPTLADTAVENAPWIGLGILGLAGAGYFAYRRRKQAEEQQAEEQDDVFAMDDSAGDNEEVADEATHFNETDETSLFDEPNETTAVAETGDVVGEADIYIAYGKLDQAEEMLLNALQKDPDSADIRMKLLEVYSQQQNGPAFDKHYAALLPLAGGALLARASELREGISGAGEFDPAASVANEAQDADLDQFSLDDFNLDDDLSVAPVATASEPTSFDFDLDLDDDESNLSSAIADAPAAVENEFELDFDDDLAAEAEDLSELSLALDNLDADTLPEDLEVKAPSIEDGFNFDLDDDLELSESAVEESAELVAAESESLEVAADDFNLDMNVDDVDLAALDHEMESLDVDFDDDLLGEDGDLGIEDLDLSDVKSAQDEISTSKLSLTDDLDKPETSMGFELDDDLVDFGVDDNAEDLEVDLAGDTEALAEASADELLPDFDLGDDDTFSFEEDALADGDLDLAALEDDLGELSESTEFDGADFAVADDIVDLELQDEIPSRPEPVQESPAVIADEAALVDAEEEHDEDLFAQALSDFSGDSDDIDLNEFSSDEAALADLSDDDMDAELDFLADADEAATKLDLARAYIDMGDSEGAKDILSEVLGEGNDEQRKEANELLGRIG
ncbi:FimV/HubP family polar landmark protein [Cellvibrio fibrivorans]|uniref:Pilus assembly protein FimV n=1 Tax=Cellvibrio fibrivorans TaxID=126350 RepID=A0ABU1UX09_9GAMM|nr:FimV/HubP family polar landmark protein [Cellvibrio fibrivorans]MDR7089729.1 pilus assembly protein FimV [Cellvibrio fibrivorans]